jgi:hypothetical protein
MAVVSIVPGCGQSGGSVETVAVPSLVVNPPGFDCRLVGRCIARRTGDAFASAV